MKRKMLWACVLWLFFSCGKADANVNTFDGTYVGYFIQNSKDTVQISFLFRENHYSGFRQKKFYPQLGKGTFEQSENGITFNNTLEQAKNTSKPALSGSYSYEINADGSVRIWRMEGTNCDEFILRPSNDESLVYGNK